MAEYLSNNAIHKRNENTGFYYI